MSKHKVTFRFETEPNKEVTIEVQEGDSILDAAHDNDIQLNHNCGAVCAYFLGGHWVQPCTFEEKKKHHFFTTCLP